MLGAATVFGCVWLLGSVWIWIRPYSGYPGREPGFPGTVLDRAIIYNDFTDIAYLLPRHLRNDFEGAIKKLREFGFGEGCKIVGASYRRHSDSEFEAKVRRLWKIRRYNQLLRDHDAVSLRVFWRRLPSSTTKGPWVRIYLLTKGDGTMKAIGWVTAGKFWVGRWKLLSVDS